MPESVQDRPTRSHEYLFLLSKSKSYYYDADAVREAAEYGENRATFRGGGVYTQGRSYFNGLSARGDGEIKPREQTTGRNRRTVWEIPTQPTPEAHFATYPEALVEPCILAGSSERGVCGTCGAPWVRVVEEVGKRENGGLRKRADAPGAVLSPTSAFRGAPTPILQTTGWQPSCKHDAPAIPATVLDIFLGSGTTARVAERLGRRWIGIELSEAYAEIARRRTAQQSLLAWAGGAS